MDLFSVSNNVWHDTMVLSALPGNTEKFKAPTVNI